jgi:hypothetical protein
MQRLRKPIASISTFNRSRVSNGTLLLQGIDGRSAPARRFRDLIHSYLEDFDVVSEADETLIRTAGHAHARTRGDDGGHGPGGARGGRRCRADGGSASITTGRSRCLSTPAVSYR